MNYCLIIFLGLLFQLKKIPPTLALATAGVSQQRDQTAQYKTLQPIFSIFKTKARYRWEIGNPGISPMTANPDTSNIDESSDDNDIDADRNQDAYWKRQIHQQGESSQEYQWFLHRDSLPFECTACGKCCKTKGNVYMTADEHEQGADLLGISKRDFLQQYASHTLVDPSNGRQWVRLRDREDSSDDNDSISSHGCIFLNDDNTCQIYEARPIQCSTYPFWPNILASQEAWNREVRRADDDTDSGLPLWTIEDGGCEGMQQVLDDDSRNNDRNQGVPRLEVYEQAYWYAHDERRFPRVKETPVKQKKAS